MTAEQRVLVFGGAGFIGIYLIRSLCQRGYIVAVADIHRNSLVPEEVDYYDCDILDEKRTKDIVEAIKPNVVYNLAGYANLDMAVKHPKETMELNVIGNINILNACVESHIGKYVYASSAYAMSDKGSFYGISKLASEKIVEEFNSRYGVDYVILRYGSLYSEMNFDNNYLFRVIKEALQNGVIEHNGDGNEIREYIHAADAANLSVNVIESEKYNNKHIILTGNERLKRKDVFLMIKEIIGNNDLKIQLSKSLDNNHYHQTPYSFNPLVSHKLIANPHIDMGQGILECVRSAYKLIEGERNESV